METLFGGRQNVMPSHVWQSSQLQQTQYAYSQMGQPPTFDFSSDSDKDDDHDDDHDEEDKLKQNDSNATTNTTTTTATASTFNPNVSCLNSLVSSNAISQSTSVTIDKISQLPGQTTTIASKSTKKRQGKNGEVTETLKNISSITMNDISSGATGMIYDLFYL
jgi:hypothetical protein